MGKVRIVTDSNAFLLPAIKEKYAIEVIPHRIKIGGAIYEEDADFTADELFKKLSEAQKAGLNRLPEVLAADVKHSFDTLKGPHTSPAYKTLLEDVATFRRVGGSRL